MDDAENQVGNAQNGLGNLADELAEAWDEDDENETSQLPSTSILQDENVSPDSSTAELRKEKRATFAHSPVASNSSLSPPKIPTRARHRRVESQYDGSDYSEASDFEDAGWISPSLDSQIAAIESLARRGTESDGSDRDDVIHRVAESLKGLPSQSGVENCASRYAHNLSLTRLAWLTDAKYRLITTHAALTSHLASQARLLQSLAHPLINPLALPPSAEVIEELLPLLATLLATLPAPMAQCLASLQNLSASTSDLQSSLTYLSDTIYMTRQTMTWASRRLRTATDMVLEMRRDAEAREEAVRWIEKGGWDRKLGDRESGRLCGDVIGGFEQVCDTWRKRLVAGAGVA